jgi:hypothetical protein
MIPSLLLVQIPLLLTRGERFFDASEQGVSDPQEHYCKTPVTVPDRLPRSVTRVWLYLA